MKTTDTLPLAERITPGPAIHHLSTDHSIPAFVTIEGEQVASALPIGHREEMNANCQLILEAFQTTADTQRTPRQLADERAELIAALERLELATVQTRIASGIGRQSAIKRYDFVIGQLEQMREHALEVLNRINGHTDTLEPEKSCSGLCNRCKHNPATEPHPCPYQSDINNDSETLCDCCDECSDECAADI